MARPAARWRLLGAGLAVLALGFSGTATSVAHDRTATATVVEENAAAGGVAVLPVTGWTVHYPGFRYIEWLTPASRRP